MEWYNACFSLAPECWPFDLGCFRIRYTILMHVNLFFFVDMMVRGAVDAETV